MLDWLKRLFNKQTIPIAHVSRQGSFTVFPKAKWQEKMLDPPVKELYK